MRSIKDMNGKVGEDVVFRLPNIGHQLRGRIVAPYMGTEYDWHVELIIGGKRDRIAIKDEEIITHA